MTRFATVLLMIAATGCATTPPADAETEAQAEAAVPIREGEDASGCDAARAAHLIGRARSAAVGDEALRLSGARLLRWIPPGTAVTMDYRTDRLNIEVDGQGKVTRISCG